MPLVIQSREGAERIRRIVTDLKVFSHPGDSKADWSDLNTGLESTLNIARNAVKYKAEVVKEFGPLPKVFCNASQLNQAFLNLIVNAAQAIEEKGTITLRTWTSGGNAYVSVADTGKGMTEDVKARVFEPFFTTKPVGNGMGLGMSVVYGILKKHGGSISVQSKQGEGTTFTIELPIRGKARETDGKAGDTDDGSGEG